VLFAQDWKNTCLLTATGKGLPLKDKLYSYYNKKPALWPGSLLNSEGFTQSETLTVPSMFMELVMA